MTRLFRGLVVFCLLGCWCCSVKVVAQGTATYAVVHDDGVYGDGNDEGACQTEDDRGTSSTSSTTTKIYDSESTTPAGSSPSPSSRSAMDPHTSPSMSMPVAGVLPIGAVYELSFKMPFVGRQSIQLTILDGKRARLVVDGGYPIDDHLTYAMLPDDNNSNTSSGGSSTTTTTFSTTKSAGPTESPPPRMRRFSVELSEDVKAVMRRFHTELSQIRYDTEQDSPSVLVSFMKIVSIPLRLRRVVVD